jgi:hypothetical protein
MDLKTGLFSAILGVSMLASSAFGVDYSTMSTEELSKMRGTMQNATIEEKNAFQNEWQKRVQNITQEEKQKYIGKPENAGQGNSEMMQERMKERMQERDTMQQRGSSMGGRMSGGFGGGRGGRR